MISKHTSTTRAAASVLQARLLKHSMRAVTAVAYIA
jgi:hypothetical protein